MKGSPALGGEEGGRGPVLQQHLANLEPAVGGDTGPMQRCQPGPWAHKVEVHSTSSAFLQEVVKLSCIAKGDEGFKLRLEGREGLGVGCG